MSGKIWQAFGRSTNREGGKCLLPEELCNKTGIPVAEVLREKHPYMQVPSMENPICALFEEYKDLPETTPLIFTEDDVTWVASKISGAAGTLGVEAIEMRH